MYFYNRERKITLHEVYRTSDSSNKSNNSGLKTNQRRRSRTLYDPKRYDPSENANKMPKMRRSRSFRPNYLCFDEECSSCKFKHPADHHFCRNVYSDGAQIEKNVKGWLKF